MFRLIILSVQFAIVIILASWIVNNSYTVSIHFKELILSTSTSYLLAIFFIVILLIFFSQSFYFKLKYKIHKFGINKQSKYREVGYNSFVEGMIALANKDYRKALIENKKVEKYLKDSSLSLLLKSETLKIEKKYDELNSTYEKMIKNKKIKILGLRGLMEQYLRAHDYHHALIYGETLFKLSPNIEKIYETLIFIIGKTNNWHTLISISDKALSLKIIDNQIYSINKSIALYEMAKIKQLNDEKESIKLMEKALGFRKNFAPYVSFYLELLISTGKFKNAKKFASKAWSENPHPDYKQQLKILAEKLNISFENFVKDITSHSKNTHDSKILIAESLIDSKKWDEASQQLSSLLEHKPSYEVCSLMSKIEEGNSNNPQKIDAWLNRANFGEMNNVWICSISNISQQSWTSVSNGGYFNSLKWSKPDSLNISESINNQISLSKIVQSK